VSAPSSPPAARVRPEIQALRAVAVVAVVVYHLWPGRLSGGFVGVDIFFVISGFLITAHLVREVTATGTVSLPRFWARRARRLLPASLLVLAVSAIGVLILAPSSLWAQFYREIAASALYIQNWALAADSIDYLAAENGPSPVQHYWSLSVEEQFYIVWPVLIVAAVMIARWARRATLQWVIWILTTVVVASLAYSVVLTMVDPSTAYFATTTRAWEFGAGGLLACLGSNNRAIDSRVRVAVAWFGWATIAASLLVISGETPFPGYAALLPVVGTLAVIWARDAHLTPSSWSRWRPVQWLGDVSYSLYLWHWPLIVFAPLALGAELGSAEKLAIVVASVVLAWVTKTWVEDPVRRGALSRARPRRTFVVTAAAMALVVGAAGIGLNAIDLRASADKALAQQLAGEECFGASALDPRHQPCVNPALDGIVVPSVEAVTRDRSTTWDECAAVGTEARECVLGTPGGTRVALVGDSHTHHWVTAVEAIAATQGWEIHMFVRGRCPFSSVDWVRTDEAQASSCKEWNGNVNAALAAQEPFELLITSLRAQSNRELITGGLTATDAATEGFRNSWQPLIDRGTLVIGIRDVPSTTPALKECAATSESPQTECLRPLDEAFSATDYLSVAAERVDGAALVDLTDYLCVPTGCPEVIGSVLVNRDDHHITAVYATTLAPYLLEAITLAKAERTAP
jgi:peptidoglycan/LPS O-acetylase OafA/YrhL